MTLKYSLLKIFRKLYLTNLFLTRFSKCLQIWKLSRRNLILCASLRGTYNCQIDAMLKWKLMAFTWLALKQLTSWPARRKKGLHLSSSGVHFWTLQTGKLSKCDHKEAAQLLIALCSNIKWWIQSINMKTPIRYYLEISH